MSLTGWDLVLWVHLLAMATFVGGQLFLVIAVVPVHRAEGGESGWLRPIARRFGWASLGAIAVALVTGIAMASHFELWDEPALHLKLGLVAAALALVALHLRAERNPLLHVLILLDSLGIVLAATML